MIRILFAIGIITLPTFVFAQVDPTNPRECLENVKGQISGLYSDNWAQRVAIKISNAHNGSSDGFYYLHGKTTNESVMETYNTAVAAYISGADITIKGCDNNGISAIQIE